MTAYPEPVRALRFPPMTRSTSCLRLRRLAGIRFDYGKPTKKRALCRLHRVNRHLLELRQVNSEARLVLSQCDVDPRAQALESDRRHGESPNFVIAHDEQAVRPTGDTAPLRQSQSKRTTVKPNECIAATAVSAEPAARTGSGQASVWGPQAFAFTPPRRASAARMRKPSAAQRLRKSVRIACSAVPSTNHFVDDFA